MAEKQNANWFQRIRGTDPNSAPRIGTQELNPHSLQALEHHKYEGMQFAVRARLIALAIIVVMLPIINTDLSVLYYMAFAILFALNGWAQLRAASVERSRLEFLLLATDLILLTLVVTIPNPFANEDQPLPMQFRFSGHEYMFIYLALGTLAYSWRTMRAYAMLGTVIWTIGAAAVWYFSSDHPGIGVFRESMAPFMDWADVLDPGNVRFDLRFQEIVIFAIVAFILSITVKRFNDLLHQNAATERERTNLARYFSPNMVDNLSTNDEPLKQIKTQDVAVLFVDIIGFTTYSNARSPQEVIKTLREFHGLMEKSVFDHGGTLDKFLGDGLMATFGTPEESDVDAANAMKCAKAMVDSVKSWNEKRAAEGHDEIRIGLGLHFGPCVLGDIGGENRLEFAVIGDTVNIASRVEAKTRELGVKIAITETFADKVMEQSGANPEALQDFQRFEHQEIRGINNSITLLGTNAGTLH